MAKDTCQFHWLIHHPTMTRRNFEATFYFQYPILTQWRATLKPTSRIDLKYVRLLFSLSCVGIWEESIISVRELLIKIAREDSLVIEEKRLPYDFRPENGHCYEFATNFYHTPQKAVSLLLITIELSFHEEYRPRKTFNRHLWQLSEDLWQLFAFARFSNLNLQPANSNAIFHVHSYILRARWNNFFRETSHHRVIGNNIEIDISLNLLLEIISYVYCGRLDITEHLQTRNNLSLMTEMFQVIDLYRIHHLYRVFATQDSGQVRETGVNLIRSEIHLWLNNFQNQLRFISPIHSGDAIFIFAINFYFRGGVFSLSYSLQSQSPRGVLARVNLGLQIANKGVLPFHERDYTIGLGRTVNSGPYLVNKDLRQQIIHCVISLSDGSTVIRVGNRYTTNMLEVYERYEILSDHMRALLNHETDSDFRVTCRFQNPNHPWETHHIHKGIFATRVPDWSAVLREVPGWGPDDMECFLSNEAFDRVLDFIYTGECRIPFVFRDEIYKFAILGEFYDLFNRFF